MVNEKVIHIFKTDAEVYEFLGQPAKVDAVRDKYPPPRYSCRIDPITRQMVITDHKAFVLGDLELGRPN